MAGLDQSAMPFGKTPNGQDSFFSVNNNHQAAQYDKSGARIDIQRPVDPALSSSAEMSQHTQIHRAPQVSAKLI